ncbi:unnamed protein product [Durusdinium trenchii]|uniref:Uncharacterized protein n=1 Tax=Durusdinium trenchii TaxID=1381693 RepID=A0ABP0S6H2_9DINO
MVAADQLATGQGKAVSTFLRKFPAAPAVLVLFKHLLSQAAETLEASVKQRLFLHGQYLSRHELNQFLTDFAGFRHVELNVVSQALFGALDLEREGQIPQDLLLERLREPPSMKEVWLADLESLWPGRESIVEYARRSPPRQSSLPRPRSSRPGSACTAPGAFAGRRPSGLPPRSKSTPKRPSTAGHARSRRDRDQQGLVQKDRRSTVRAQRAATPGRCGEYSNELNKNECIRSKHIYIYIFNPTSPGNNDLSLKMRPTLYCKKKNNPPPGVW